MQSLKAELQGYPIGKQFSLFTGDGAGDWDKWGSEKPEGQATRSDLIKTLDGESLRSLSQKVCPRCLSSVAVKAPGKGPHYAALRCAECNRFIEWLSKPRAVVGGAT